MGTGCVTRQPILGLHSRVHGYELLFQMDGAAAAEVDELQATRSILDEMVLFGLERLTGGATAFIKCTVESLTEQLVAVLPPATTVLEISQSLEMTPKLLVACRQLKERGFRLALADFTGSAAPHPRGRSHRLCQGRPDPHARRRTIASVAGRHCSGHGGKRHRDARGLSQSARPWDANIFRATTSVIQSRFTTRRSRPTGYFISRFFASCSETLSN